MPLIRATVNFETSTMLPKDRCTNTFWFDNTSGTPYAGVLVGLTEIIENFYSAVFNTYNQGNWCSGGSTANNFVSYVDWSAPTPRVATDIYMAGSLWNYGTTLIPTEVACVLSFHGAPLSGASQARRRGRIYLAGVRELWLDQEAAGSAPAFTDAFLLQLGAAAVTFAGECDTLGTPWVVYSRVNAAAVPVVGGWVDESPDTQRRRSVDATERQIWEYP